jgi:hypothetical protein
MRKRRGSGEGWERHLTVEEMRLLRRISRRQLLRTT